MIDRSNKCSSSQLPITLLAPSLIHMPRKEPEIFYSYLLLSTLSLIILIFTMAVKKWISIRTLYGGLNSLSFIYFYWNEFTTHRFHFLNGIFKSSSGIQFEDWFDATCSNIWRTVRYEFKYYLNRMHFTIVVDPPIIIIIIIIWILPWMVVDAFASLMRLWMIFNWKYFVLRNQWGIPMLDTIYMQIYNDYKYVFI